MRNDEETANHPFIQWAFNVCLPVPGESCSTRRVEVLRKKKKNPHDRDMSKEHISKLKDFPVVKAATIWAM